MHVLALFEFNISQKCIISAFLKVQVVFGDPDLGQSTSPSLTFRSRRPRLSLNRPKAFYFTVIGTITRKL